ncbi:hypothetical protein VTN31DRAFT_5867 [Thermomyces dupontii]|uniref:uncharacterized protein n=1 Tax=Talaromyces thermophilus TaxID=28565 RepID=UPI003741F287
MSSKSATGLSTGLSETLTYPSMPSSSTDPDSRQKAKEKAAAIKTAQEKALTQLPLCPLYIVLYIQSDPPVANDFHWSFYHHLNLTEGVEYQVRNVGDGWITDHGWRSCICKQQFLCVLVQIGIVPEKRRDQLDEIMRMHDAKANEIPGVTYRVWLFTILEEPMKAGLVQFDNVCSKIASILGMSMLSAAANDQPRPVVSSTLCL